MAKYFFTFFILSLLFVTISFSNKTELNKYKTKHVVILVLDGPRWSETFGDPEFKLVPHLKHDLAPLGVFFNDFANDGVTYTNSGHTAITTGVYQRMENSGKEIPKKPSIFQYFLKQKKVDKRKAWILTSKGKLNILGHTKDKKWARQFYPSVYSGINGSGLGYPSDKYMWPIFMDIIETNKPIITLINLLDIDAWAHAENKARYLSSIRQNDSLSLDLWNRLQAIPEFRNQTTLFITNDHGRHLDGRKNGYVSHGDGCEGCRKISLIGIGPDFKVNAEVNNHYDLLDINATAAELLNVSVPTSKGDVIWEMFSGSN